MKVIIMRGVSGSGKSTYIKKHFPDGYVCSADHFFIKDGEYKFDVSMLHNAHKNCLENFEQALKNNIPLVIVDNTNTKYWEFDRYLDLADDYGYETEVIRLKIDWKTAAGRNAHGVPKANVKAMNDRMAPYDGETVVENY